MQNEPKLCAVTSIIRKKKCISIFYVDITCKYGVQEDYIIIFMMLYTNILRLLFFRFLLLIHNRVVVSTKNMLYVHYYVMWKLCEIEGKKMQLNCF